jgi:tRNA A-37 threonylcarbamoyl transferase component Bud32
MHRSLGAKIGEGATADVYEWAPGQIVKLFKVGIPQHISRYEAQITRAVHTAGALAPEVIDEVIVEGRIGLVIARLDGPTLMQATKIKSVSYEEAGAILADRLYAVHVTSLLPEIPLLRDYLMSSLRHASSTLSNHVVAGVLDLIDRLSPGDALCHGDPNPGNVVLTADGPRLIDWIGALRAPAEYDLASAQVLLTELAPFAADDPARPLAIHAAIQTTYAGLAGTSPAALAVTVEAYLPIVRALLLLNGAVPAHRARLMQRLEVDFPT